MQLTFARNAFVMGVGRRCKIKLCGAEDRTHDSTPANDEKLKRRYEKQVPREQVPANGVLTRCLNRRTLHAANRVNWLESLNRYLGNRFKLNACGVECLWTRADHTLESAHKTVTSAVQAEVQNT